MTEMQGVKDRNEGATLSVVTDFLFRRQRSRLVIITTLYSPTRVVWTLHPRSPKQLRR